MKNLILVRHAKSSWEVPVQDKDRVLTCNGMKDAHLVAGHVKSLLPKTFTIWCSIAKRTTNTALIFAQNFLFPLDSIIYKDDLYTFDRKQLQKVVESCPDDIESLMIFGHNEAITDFVNRYGDVSIDNVPTSGLVFLKFDSPHWKTIKKAKTEHILFPKDLK
ncbi:SixA phosphatase family protein [Flavobacterium tiangeerense]|uniref:SixA phosphatase family protein n=1 Tax=Flavobacterium tiangeerense TaxID=459471 RepID=UPI0011A0AA94|nr:histidine phosphatase family protein [Flavobacterium tiangeerense]